MNLITIKSKNNQTDSFFWLRCLSYLLLPIVILACSPEQPPITRPNIILILADDMGYGDLSCYNPEAKFQTPHIDQLAREGMLFTDAHSPSAVCTPTRYSILTGRYAWRSRLKEWVLWEWDPPLIEPEHTTLAQFLQQQDYHTAAVGKWHLGWNWPTVDSISAKQTNGSNVDYNQPVLGGPLSYGFEYYFGDDVPNFPPYTFIENDRVADIPTENKPNTMFGKAGKMAPGWKLADVMPDITKKAVEYIQNNSAEATQPFFLYFALTAPHTPIVPALDFKDKSTVGPYGDFVVEVDWSVGQIVEALEKTGQRENTIIFFTSDNGSPARDGTNQSGAIGSVITNFGHLPNGNLRGLKADIWEGGHRVPFIVNWKDHIGDGQVSDYPVSSLDLYRTIADLLEKAFPGDEKAQQDSYSLLPLLSGEEDERLRNRSLIHHSGAGVFAIRKGPWKLIISDKSGGFSDNINPDGYGIAAEGQLYNLENDLGEKRNLYDTRPDIVSELKSLLANAR